MGCNIILMAITITPDENIRIKKRALATGMNNVFVPTTGKLELIISFWSKQREKLNFGERRETT
jgi:hypothetical protein